jgi:aminoglycoside phosphotransferase (APT) family kinase protein
VPPFFAHEAAIIRQLAVPWVPRLIAADGRRSLMEEIAGEDGYDAGAEELGPAIVRLVRLQAAWAPRIDQLLALGLPDWRGPAVTAAIAEVVARCREEVDDDDRRALDALVASLGDRWDRIAACGIPDSLVHGDFAGGNLRGVGHDLVLLDWGDAGVGHPLLDQPAMLDRAPGEAVEPLRRQWVDAWTSTVPGSDPTTAARLLAPVAAARQAVIYQSFVDRIEPSERPYHRADVPRWLRRAAALSRTEGG